MQPFHASNIFLVLMAVEGTYGCWCENTHPQWLLCRSDYVIKALVKTSVTEYSDNHPLEFLGSSSFRPSHDYSFFTDRWTKYSVYIEKVFKGSKWAVPKTYANITADSDRECDPAYLEVNRSYVIMGEADRINVLDLNPCSFSRRFDKLTRMQLKGIKSSYQRACRECLICASMRYAPCATVDGPVPDHEQCIFRSPSFDTDDKEVHCETEFAKCGRKKGQCTWVGRSDYKRCKRREQALM